MSFEREIGPYASPFSGSVLETETVLSSILRPEGYHKGTITDIAIRSFLDFEHASIAKGVSMHLLAIKKALLYATPVIAQTNASKGIALTSQVITAAIQYDTKKNSVKSVGLTIGDKFRLLGFSFSPRLVNKLSFDIFPWKEFEVNTGDLDPVDISHLASIETKKTKYGTIFLINSKEYENVSLFNQINQIIARKLSVDMSVILANKLESPSKRFPTIPRMKPFNAVNHIKKLNQVLPRQIEPTYTMSEYEALQITANWLLYDQIVLLGFESPEVHNQLAHLQYVKEQTLKVQENVRELRLKTLLSTRAEKITRERYPYFFDYTDRRSLFVKFKRFNIEKLPQKERKDVELILKKELAAQEAILRNNCEHLVPLKRLSEAGSNKLEVYPEVEKYINMKLLDDDGMYVCKLCSYPIMCLHEVDFYDMLSSIGKSDDTDQIYLINRQIINKYKLVNQRRTGNEDTEVSFTYYCKHCGGELGKSDNVIQSTYKSQSDSNATTIFDETEEIILSTIISVVRTHMNHTVAPVSLKAVSNLIYGEARGRIFEFLKKTKKNEQANIDIFVKYLSYIYACAALIAINTHSFKLTESIFTHSSTKESETSPVEVVGGVALKEEMISALKIIQSVNAFKQIGTTSDKIKVLLIDAFKYMSKTFSREDIDLKAFSPRDRMITNILSNPLTMYAQYMYNRDNKPERPLLEIVGVNMESLFPKNKKANKVSTHALFTNIYTPNKKESTERGRYIQESYKTITEFAQTEPIVGKYTSIITPPLSEFILSYEKKQTMNLILKREIPVWVLAVENNREYDFDLKILQLAYCADTVRPHRWKTSMDNDRTIFVCKYCNLNIAEVHKSANDKINELLDQQMLIEAFFEMYAISCPIKDAHIFENSKCTQCDVAKEQINKMDPQYYKKYSPTYLKYREAITNGLIKDANAIVSYASPVDYVEINKTAKSPVPDKVKLESLMSSLSKLYNLKNINSIGVEPSGKCSLETIESYVRLFYSHYTFVKNISMDTKSHPDILFFGFIKQQFFNGIHPKQLNLPPLPDYPTSTNAESLLTTLFQTMYDLVSNGDASTNLLVEFIAKKIMSQDSKRKEFNYAKLKTVGTIIEEDRDTGNSINEEVEDEELDMFDGYDMSTEDMEDNMDGDLD